MEELREYFEQFAREKMLDGVERKPDDTYQNHDVQFAWNVWRNAVDTARAIHEMHISIERGQKQRARWNDSLTVAMSELAELFPTMRGVPGTRPWDVHKLMAWMNTGAPTHGSWYAAMFLLGVWNPHTNWKQEGVKMKKEATGKFDLFRAMQGWDQQHIDAAMEWIQNPFFP